VGHLESVGQQANDYRRLRESDVGWPLDELWIGSELLDSPAELEATTDARDGRSGAAKAQAVDLRLCVGAAGFEPAASAV
jgi:hypothetical protein